MCQDCYEASASASPAGSESDLASTDEEGATDFEPWTRGSGDSREGTADGSSSKGGGAVAWIVGAIVVVLGGLGALSLRSSPSGIQAEIQAHLDAIEKAGEPITLQELNDWYQHVPPDENAATIYLKAFPKIDINGTSDRSQDIDLLEKPPFNLREIKLLGQIVNRNRAPLRLLHKAAAIPQARYPIDFNQVPLDNRYIFGFKQAAHVLRLEALYYAMRNAPRKAAESVGAQLALCRSLQGEPMMLSQILRFAGWRITLGTLEALLDNHRLAPESLTLLTDYLEEAKDTDGIRRAFIGERVLTLHRFKNPDQYDHEVVTGYTFSDKGQETHRVSLPRGRVWDKNFLFYLEGVREISQSMNKGFREWKAATQTLNQKIGDSEKGDPLFFAKDRLQGIREMPKRYASGRATLHTMRAGLAIEQFRNAERRLPETLATLTPTYLEEVPKDPFGFGDATIRYRPLNPGYVVYSVGKDKEGQQGGVFTLSDKSDDIALAVNR